MKVAQVEGIETIRVPTLVTAGADDILVPSSESRTIHDCIAGSTYHEFEGCGHASNIEDFENFNRIQSAFFDEADRGA